MCLFGDVTSRAEIERLHPEAALELSKTLRDPSDPEELLLDEVPSFLPFAALSVPRGVSVPLNDNQRSALEDRAAGLTPQRTAEVRGSKQAPGTIRSHLGQAVHALFARKARDAVSRAVVLGEIRVFPIEKLFDPAGVTGRAVHALGLSAIGIERNEMKQYTGLTTFSPRLETLSRALCGDETEDSVQTVSQAYARMLLVRGRPYRREPATEVGQFAVKSGSINALLDAATRAKVVAAYERGELSGGDLAKRYKVSRNYMYYLLGEWKREHSG